MKECFHPRHRWLPGVASNADFAKRQVERFGRTRYHIAMKDSKTPLVIGVSGIKNSGKTTLMVKLVAALTQQGLRVATIKHDAHAFQADTPGRDSYRHKQAGAFASAVFDQEKFQLVKDGQQTIDGLLSLMQEADLVLLEGAKLSPYPKIEIVRKGVSDNIVTDPGLLLLVATDTDLVIPGVPSLDINDVQGMVKIIMGLLQQ